MLAVLLAGALGFHELPVSALPQVDYPTIQILTFYPGASAQVMASSVTAPLERQLGQMPGLKQMFSRDPEPVRHALPTPAEGDALLDMLFDDAVSSEQVLQAQFGGIEGKVSYEELVVHDDYCLD